MIWLVAGPELLLELMRVHVQILLASAHPVVMDALLHQERRILLPCEARVEGSRVDVELLIEWLEARLAWRKVVKTLAINAIIVFCRGRHGRVKGI